MVMDTLGIDVDAQESANMTTFKKITVDTGAFEYEELVVWFQMLSKISKCQGLAVRAENYAHRIVEDDEMNEGRFWLKADKEYSSFMKQAHYQVLMEFGLDRDVQLPFMGTPGAQIPVTSPFTPGVASYGNSLPTPPVMKDTAGITAAMAGFTLKHP